jgi:2-polyprenyl-6-methoxyphenol hydroxylase-like FAD-dependent oxidoreductase
MKGDGLRAIIIGAGPGGLTAAKALRDAGWFPLCFDRVSSVGESGSGLTLWPNAMEALEVIGLKQAVESVCFPTAGIRMRSWRGESLFEVPSFKTPDNRFGVSGAAAHRGELMAALLSAFSKGELNLESRCIGFRQNETSVTAFFDNGWEVSGDMLIAADGINSTLRSQMFGRLKLRYAGYTVWRGVADFKLGADIGETWLGRGAQFGFFPMTRDRVYWFASVNAPEGEAEWEIGRKQELKKRFRNWHEPIQSLIDSTVELSIIRNDIYDMKPLKSWSVGRATLLGDAAHPSTPTLGQGACQAIEDAVVLAACLREASDIVSALKNYESRRIHRTSAITIQSRRMGQMGSWKNPLACWLRDNLIRSVPASIRLQQLNGMFRFEM